MVDYPMNTKALYSREDSAVVGEPKSKPGRVTSSQQIVGTCAIYAIALTTSSQQKELDEFFAEIGTVAQTYKLSTGRLASYAVRVSAEWIDALEEIATALGDYYRNVSYLHPADEVSIDVISELCRVTESKMVPIPRCGICGRRELFPPVSIVINGRGSRPTVRRYCSTCTADKFRQKTRDFVRALLDADRRNLKGLQQAKLVRSNLRRNISFTVALPTNGLAG